MLKFAIKFTVKVIFLHFYIPSSIPHHPSPIIHHPSSIIRHSYIPIFLQSYIPTFLHSYIPIFLHSYIPTYLHSYLHIIYLFVSYKLVGLLGLLLIGPTLSSFNAEGIYRCMIDSKLTVVLPDQAVLEKNSTYGRQSISRPMRIVAPIP